MIRTFLIACALMLSACTMSPAVPTAPTAIGNTVVLSGTDALARAADAYAGVAAVAETAVRHGAFSNDQLRMIRTLSDHIHGLLNGADTTLTAAQRAASILVAVGQLRSIVGN